MKNVKGGLDHSLYIVTVHSGVERGPGFIDWGGHLFMKSSCINYNMAECFTEKLRRCLIEHVWYGTTIV